MDETACDSSSAPPSGDTIAPPCPKCQNISQYYPEYGCHWCDSCQDYVYAGENDDKGIASERAVDLKIQSPILSSPDDAVPP